MRYYLPAGMAALLLLIAPMEDARAQDAPTVAEVTFGSSEPPVGLAETVFVEVKFSGPVVATGTP